MSDGVNFAVVWFHRLQDRNLMVAACDRVLVWAMGEGLLPDEDRTAVIETRRYRRDDSLERYV